MIRAHQFSRCASGDIGKITRFHCGDDGRIVALRLPMDADIKQEFTAVLVEIHASQAALRQEIRQEIREEGITTRRHCDVVAESLQMSSASSPKVLSHSTQRWRRSGANR